MQLSTTKVHDFAKQAADEYLETGKLNEAIAKLAVANELTPTQIQRVVEAANHEVNASHYKNANDKRYVFELADRDKVLALMGAGPAKEATKVANLSDFFSLERDQRAHEKEASVEVHREGLIRRMNGGDAAKDALVHELQRTYAKLASYLKDVRVEAQSCSLRQGANLTAFTKEAQRLMLEESIPFQTMFKGAMESGQVHEDLTKAIFQEAYDRLIKNANAVEKKLLDKFDPASTERMGMRVINGNQPLFVHLRATAGDAINRACIGCYDEAVNNCLAGVVTAMHTLNTNEDVEKYIEQEVQPFAYNVQKGVKYAMEYVREHAKDDTWLPKTANWMSVAALLDKVGRVFQLMNQGGKAVESGGSNVAGFVRDLFSPALIRPGSATSVAGEMGRQTG